MVLAASTTTSPPRGAKRVCVYNVNTISGLSSFSALVGRQVVDCAMVYGGAATWDAWVNPWFLHDSVPDMNWVAWVTDSPASDRRQLIISQPLIPYGIATDDWRTVGAQGHYAGYARTFAQNLVAAGLHDAIIRLSWEMNGTWGYDSLGTTSQQMSQWKRFWRKTIFAMRSVPGQSFKFVWCINNRYRNIPFADYYPGNDVVDIIGDDAYDSGDSPMGSSRWDMVYASPGGLGDLTAFARAHRKPLSLPEWGVGVPNASNHAGGDDPAYVTGVGHFVADNTVAFSTYFFAHEWATQLATGPASLAAYRAAFGDGGYAVGTSDGLG